MTRCWAAESSRKPDAGRRPAGRWQIDAAAADRRASSRLRRSRLRLRRRVGRASEAPGRADAARTSAVRQAQDGCLSRDESARRARSARTPRAAGADRRLDSNGLASRIGSLCGQRDADSRLHASADGVREANRLRDVSSSGTSPRMARSPARACSSTWSTPCSTSRERRAASTASCAHTRTASVRSTRFASSRCTMRACARSPIRPSSFSARATQRPSGSCVVASIVGSRPVLIEVQALVGETSYGMPRRLANNLDQQRLAMILAVLERRAGFALGTHDVYASVAGGLRDRRAGRGSRHRSGDRVVVSQRRDSRAHRRLRRARIYPARCAPSAAAERREAEARKLGYAHVHLSGEYARHRRGDREGAGLKAIGSCLRSCRIFRKAAMPRRSMRRSRRSKRPVRA